MAAAKFAPLVAARDMTCIALAIVFSAWNFPLWAQDGPPALAVVGVSISVSDLDRARQFYTEILTFEAKEEIVVQGPEIDRLVGVFGTRARILRLELGSEQIELIEYTTPRGRPILAGSRSNDLWFQHIAIIVTDMQQAYAHLREHGVEHASTGPQRLPDWNEAAGGIEAFYFKDPDGHTLEILAFPEGKGETRWHLSNGRLFLGIDHTAIVVENTDISLGFYRDLLGMHVGGESENWGPEQERLNNVFGARLRITSLHASAGPAIELLEYLAPGNGRPMPMDTKANDLWSWVTRIRVADLAFALAGARGGRLELVSAGPVRLSSPAWESRQGMMVRDPDRHALLLLK